MQLRDADAVMMLYHTDASLEQLVTFWKGVVAEQAPEKCLIYLVHTKCDVTGKQADKIKQYTHKLKAKLYREVSSKTGDGVREVFQELGA